MNYSRQSFCTISLPHGIYVIGGFNGEYALKSI
jgi:hypothetical protein